MKEIEILSDKALKYKESGLTDYEIADELNVSKETAVWLLSKRKEKKPEGEVKIGWRSIGVFPARLGFIADAISDIILEESANRKLELDTVAAIAINGIPYATYVADNLDLELAVFRPHYQKSGAFSSNFASVAGKNVVIVDDVVGTGDTLKSAIKATKAEKGTPLLCCSLVNKRAMNDIAGVPLRALVRARAL